MDTDLRTELFSHVGNALSRLAVTRDFNEISKAGGDGNTFREAIENAVLSNAWFTTDNVYKALYILGVSIDRVELQQWIASYRIASSSTNKSVAVIMAGNIPAVGFHDFLSVLMAGHKVIAKLSSDDRYLIPAIAGFLTTLEPAFGEYISFTDGTVKGFDAVIATGSNNTARYFNYYFGKYPHIIRKNRNALGVITGNESADELKGLGEDIFSYFGLGCRNISRLLVPKDYDFRPFFDAMAEFSEVGEHHKYRNNYDYNKSIYLVNGEAHLDNGFLLLKRSTGMASPVSVLYYDEYASLKDVNNYIKVESENIQCVVSVLEVLPGSVRPGTAQYPKLWDYADGVDTMDFLTGL